MNQADRHTPAWQPAILLLTAFAVALAFRLPALERRPMHSDEANQAVKTGILLEKGEYRYDPNDHHGPTLYYFGLLSARLTGAARLADTRESTFRMVSVVFGAALILLLWSLRDALGPAAVVFAALLIAISPAFVFYSRYYIQEMSLVFFTLAAIVSGYRYCHRPSWTWAAVFGFSLGLMHATKETCVIAWAAMAGGMTAALLGTGQPLRKMLHESGVKAGHIATAFTTTSVIWLAFYSSFFTNPRGLIDSVQAYGGYLHASRGGSIHDKPWYYYLQILLSVQRSPGPWWSEAFVLAMSVVGAGVAIRGGNHHRRPFLRFLLVYTVLMTVIYAVIPYKTPWNLLGFYFALILLAGVGAAWCYEKTRVVWFRALVLAVFALGAGHLALQSYRSNTEYYADPRNPYVYAHPSTAFMRLVERLNDIAAVSPDGRGLFIAVVQPDRDYWPLPWYLRKFTRVGYWDTLPEGINPDLLIASPEMHDDLVSRFSATHMYEIQGLRPSVLRIVFIRKELWDAFIATRT